MYKHEPFPLKLCLTTLFFFDQNIFDIVENYTQSELKSTLFICKYTQNNCLGCLIFLLFVVSGIILAYIHTHKHTLSHIPDTRKSGNM